MIPAYNGPEPYIFVSYAHKDSKEVYSTIEELTSLGYRVWYDEGIRPGVEWPENIAVHLDRCALFMMFISKSSMDSANCRREINFALSRSKPFLCIVLEETEIPLGMELQLASQQSIFKYQYRSEKDYILKVCSAAGMSVCKSTHYFSENRPELARMDAAPHESWASRTGEVQMSSTPAARAEDTSKRREKTASKPVDRKKSRQKAKTSSKKGSGSIVTLVGLAIVVALVAYLMMRTAFYGGSADPTLTPTPTPTVTAEGTTGEGTTAEATSPSQTTEEASQTKGTEDGTTAGTDEQTDDQENAGNAGTADTQGGDAAGNAGTVGNAGTENTDT